MTRRESTGCLNTRLRSYTLPEYEYFTLRSHSTGPRNRDSAEIDTFKDKEMSPSHPRPSSGQGSKPKPKSRNVTPSTPTSIYPIPPLGAIFLTHFHDTKGQNVVHYISNDDTSGSPS
jgi:hypothetical protein